MKVSSAHRVQGESAHMFAKSAEGSMVMGNALTNGLLSLLVKGDFRGEDGQASLAIHGINDFLFVWENQRGERVVIATEAPTSPAVGEGATLRDNIYVEVYDLDKALAEADPAVEGFPSFTLTRRTACALDMAIPLEEIRSFSAIFSENGFDLGPADIQAILENNYPGQPHIVGEVRVEPRQSLANLELIAGAIPSLATAAA